MAELNRVEVMKQIFAQAQKLMVAQQAAITAKLEEDQAKAELERLNGSTTVDLARSDRRFFECEGDPEIRLKWGMGRPSGDRKKCDGLVIFDSWQLRDNQIPDPKTLRCQACQYAESRQADDRKRNQPPEPIAPEPPRQPHEATPATVAEEVPF